MSVKYTNGNILETEAEVLAHGVAGHQIEDMGTGLAKQINERWPDSYSRFKKARRSNSFRPGEVIIDWENSPAIAYLATQENLQNAETPYVNRSLRQLRMQLEKEGTETCAIPKIGCGYGKLEWDTIKCLIEEKLGPSNVSFTVFE